MRLKKFKISGKPHKLKAIAKATHRLKRWDYTIRKEHMVVEIKSAAVEQSFKEQCEFYLNRQPYQL